MSYKLNYLDKKGLAKVFSLIKFGHKKIWHGTLAEWEALDATEKAKYDQAEVIDEYTGVPVVVDKVEEGNLNPVTSNAVYNASAKIKSYMNVEYSLDSGEPTNVPALSPTGWFNTGLKVNTDKVAVVFRFQYCLDSNDNVVMPLAQYDTATDANGNLRFRFINVSNTTKECVKCKVFFSLIGKSSDLPN